MHDDKLAKFRSEPAAEIRIQWMKLIGLDNEEILESLLNDPVIDVASEQEQLDAAIRLNNL